MLLHQVESGFELEGVGETLDVLCGNVQFGVVGKWRCGWVVGGFLLFAFVLVLPKHCLLKPLRSRQSGLSGRGGKWIGGAHPLSPFCGASPSPRPVESTPLSPFVGAPRLGLFCPPPPVGDPLCWHQNGPPARLEKAGFGVFPAFSEFC